MNRRLAVAVERFPIAGHFTISRGSRTEAVVITAAIEGDGRAGRGECVPYARYGETVESVKAQIESARAAVEAGSGRAKLAAILPPGAARSALDCALWDLEAKIAGSPAHVLAGIDRLRPVTTAFTISLAEPAGMAAAALEAADRPILKIKLGAPDGDRERIAAVRSVVPDATLLVDANEGWTPENLMANLEACANAGVALVEQPLEEGVDGILRSIAPPVPIYADESAHDCRDLDDLVGKYEGVNIKLDKAGGLTEALAMAGAAHVRGLGVMVGCMVGTSLAMAPAMLLTPKARFVDLDGPLLLARDRSCGLTYRGSVVLPPTPDLWG